LVEEKKRRMRMAPKREKEGAEDSRQKFFFSLKQRQPFLLSLLNIDRIREYDTVALSIPFFTHVSPTSFFPKLSTYMN
jgi:hypothetical protein